AFISCQEQDLSRNGVPKDIIESLKAAGFDTDHNLYAYQDGYLVENDIFLTADQIHELAKPVSAGKHGSEEHYRTTNLVTAISTIKVWFDPAFGANNKVEFDAAIARYNALNLTLTFQSVATEPEANIAIKSFYENSSVLGRSAGFPTSTGYPASPITLNTKYYSSTLAVRGDTKTVIAHEIGHAIGFRHTDYMNRKYSCGPGPGSNEGTAGVGAILIPGTPTGPDANSWMLACSSGKDRPFTTNDQTALTTVY
ncbi:MAG: M57 family metalloprotease, partial [Bacteroidota bacterium]